jgi:hypothetical protein
MKDSKIYKHLKELQQELNRLIGTDAPTKDALIVLKKDIDKTLRQLEHSDTGELDHESLGQRLSESLNYFSAAHPNLAAVINNILNTLSGSGV